MLLPGGVEGCLGEGLVERRCWLCDGRIRGQDGITVESLGGVTVHARCFPDLGGAVDGPLESSVE